MQRAPAALTRAGARPFLAGCCLALWAYAAPGHAQADPDFAAAKRLLETGNAQAAWEMLAPHEARLAGDPEYDFLLGVAALESGRPNLATLVLERVVAINPGHVAARLEMARSYFALRDYERAEREFDAVLKADPPPEIRTLAARYVERMKARLVGERRLSGYVELAIGRDTNVNAATAQGSVFLPGFGVEFFPDPLSIRQADSFATLGAGLELAKPLAGGRTLLAGTAAKRRAHVDLSAFDSITADVHVGLETRLDEDDSVRFGLAHNVHRLDEPTYRRIQVASAEWTRRFQPRLRGSLLVNAQRIRYAPDDLAPNDSNLFLVGAMLERAPAAERDTVVSGGLFAGADEADADRDDGDRRLIAASLTLQRRLSARTDGYASLLLSRSEYDRRNLSFDEMRRDRQLEASIGVSWTLGKDWLLRPQLAYTRNRSNLSLHDYRRAEASLALRRLWR